MVPASGRTAEAGSSSRHAHPVVRRTRFRKRRTVLFSAVVAIVVAVWIGAGNPAKSASERAKVSPGVYALDPSYFAPGACMSLAPTKGNRHTTVFLDAGHGGIDPGGTGQTEAGTPIVESTLNLPIELDVANLLRANGFTVVVSRTANTTVLRLGAADVAGGDLTLVGAHDDEAARDVCANDGHASLLVGIYMDSSSSPDNAGSLAAYDLARPFWRDNARFAQLLQSDVLAAMNARGWQIPDDGVLSDASLGSSVPTDDPGAPLAAEAKAYDHLMLLGPAEAGYFTTPSRMPGALIEPLYLSDPFEGSIADSELGQKVIAGGIAKAVESYFTPRTPGTSAPVTTTAGV